MTVKVDDTSASLPVITGTEDHFSYVVSEEETYHGDDVVREGKSSSWLCIVLEGHADIIRESAKGPLRIVRLGPGALVGSMASIYKTKGQRSATLIARRGLVIGMLDIERIHTEFIRISKDLQKIVLGLDKRLTEVTQRVVETYAGELDLAAFTRDRKLLIKQGSQEQGVSLITAGSASIVQTRQKGHVPLARLGPGDFIGPLPFLALGQEPGAASVMGSADFAAEPMDTEALKAGFRESTEIVRAFMEHVAACIRATAALVGNPEKIAAAQED